MSEFLIKYFRLLYDQIHFPIQVINEDGKIVYVNHAFTFQWGYNISELNNYSVYNDMELKRSGVQDLIKKTFSEKNYCFSNNYSDLLLKSKEITIPYFRTKIFYTSLDDKNYVILFHEDQTEMLLAEEEIRKARDGNREAERLKDNFLNVLSHELRTPLNIILGYSSIIKESLKDKLNPEDRIYVDNLYSGSERLYKSITQMLEFAQIESSNYSVSFETVNLLTLLNSKIDSFRNEISGKNLDLRLINKDKTILVDIDIQCVENAINNLLENAVKFTKQGFIEIETELVHDKELAVCKIRDSGVGISSEYLDYLFQPFSQEDLNIGRSYEGNGLGLALAKRYLELMGGSLLVDSIKEVGSTFTFTLPLSRNAINNKKGKLGDEENDLKNILLFDDTGESIELLRAYLKHDYDIDSSELKKFKKTILNDKSINIFIIDVNPNQWDEGLNICKQIKQNDKSERPVIIISSEFMENKIKEFYTAGADKFIVKPFSKNGLFKALQ